MKVRRSKNVKTRDDPGFGGIVYVHHRNDFFAASLDVYHVIRSLPYEFTEVPPDWYPTYSRLAGLGICETLDPVLEEIPYSGPSFLGKFQEVPCVDKPLVINCFTTAYCPLSCIYCHADDLMKEYRNSENDINTVNGQIDLRNVISTTLLVPAMVAVLTGGDPLIKPERTINLVEGLGKHMPLVVDTSGYGEIDKLLPIFHDYDVHVRVSLDSLSKENDQWRIINPKYRSISAYSSSRESALRTIDMCLEKGVGLTVQTVVHSKNDKYSQLLDLRDGLINLGVKNWVLHIAISGGLARKKEMAVQKSRKVRGSVLPGNNVRPEIWKLIDETIRDDINIDIRCTDNNSTPNSVLLINSEGSLYTEGLAHNGKVKLFDAKTQKPCQFREMWASIDWLGHSRRYLNWNPWYYNHKDLEKTCYLVPVPKDEKSIEI